jgi:hypothetical protein
VGILRFPEIEIIGIIAVGVLMNQYPDSLLAGCFFPKNPQLSLT